MSRWLLFSGGSVDNHSIFSVDTVPNLNCRSRARKAATSVGISLRRHSWRKPFTAWRTPAATQRTTICPPRQRFTYRVRLIRLPAAFVVVSRVLHEGAGLALDSPLHEAEVPQDCRRRGPGSGGARGSWPSSARRRGASASSWSWCGPDPHGVAAAAAAPVTCVWGAEPSGGQPSVLLARPRDESQGRPTWWHHAASAAGARALILRPRLTVSAVLHRSSTALLVAFPPHQRIPWGRFPGS